MGNIKFRLIYIVIWLLLLCGCAWIGQTYEINWLMTVTKILGALGILAFGVLVYYGFKNLFSGK
jgi:hypothetical protein